MSQEAQGHDPEEAPAPPATTRWSEEPAGDDDLLAPPFVPGRPSSASTPSRVEEAAAEEIAPEPLDEIAAEPVDEEPFPFDTPYGAGEPEAAEASGAAAAASAAETAEEDFPFDSFDIEGTDEPAPEPRVERSAAGMGWTPADLDLEEVAEERPETGKGGEPTASAEAEAVGASPTAAAASAEREPAPSRAENDAAAEAAALLERLSLVLRTQGEDGVRQEMESPDRLTALLAGLLAGYVSGRS